MTTNPLRLSVEESAELRLAQAKGASSVRIYRDGVFSPKDFIAFGVLERLAIRGLLIRRGLERTGSDAVYRYDLAPPARPHGAAATAAA
jgi:hypothetical protein